MAKAVLQFELAGPTSNPIIRMTGEFDLAGREAFSTVVEQVLSSATTLTIDMREVRFIDSTGVRALFSAHRRCVQTGTEMLLVESAAVERVFKSLGIVNTFNRVIPDGVRSVHGERQETDEAKPYELEAALAFSKPIELERRRDIQEQLWALLALESSRVEESWPAGVRWERDELLVARFHLVAEETDVALSEAKKRLTGWMSQSLEKASIIVRMVRPA